MTIQMNAIQSTSISEAGYRRRTMRVKFANGKTYELKKVPRLEYDNFLKANSKGRYFLREIKSHYPSAEIH